ncbi:hypothetical protein C8Q77DRAFT_570171 [Trametes polyzona]|nr:hypothetical protein C8Q77DRAFT_570171 [Trametes polyzona]
MHIPHQPRVSSHLILIPSHPHPIPSSSHPISFHSSSAILVLIIVYSIVSRTRVPVVIAIVVIVVALLLCGYWSTEYLVISSLILDPPLSFLLFSPFSLVGSPLPSPPLLAPCTTSDSFPIRTIDTPRARSRAPVRCYIRIYTEYALRRVVSCRAAIHMFEPNNPPTPPVL